MADSPGYSFLEAKQKIESFCAYQERCDYDVRRKLYEWKLSSEDVDALISHLISYNFLNEERFAEAYVSGKFRIKKWGRVKIRQQLKLKKISLYSINKAFLQLDDAEYIQTAKDLVVSKSRLIKSKNPWDKVNKLKRYLASKGYETELIHEIVGGESD
jgi:regulatory protein